MMIRYWKMAGFVLGWAMLALMKPSWTAAQLLPEQSLAAMETAEGLEATLFAAEPDVINPTAMDIDDRGRVWITEAVNYRIFKNPVVREEGDRVVVLEDADGDGVAEKVSIFYQGPDLQSPIGIAVLGDRVYICQSPDIFYLEDTDGDGVADQKTVVLTGFGGIDHDHGIHGLHFGPDGWLYMTNGDRGLDVTDKRGHRVRVGRGAPHGAASLLRMDLDGNRLELLADGMRNPYEPATDSFGNVFIADNDDDGNEQVRIVYAMRGGNYGYWPHRSGDRHDGAIHWNEDRPGVIPKILRTGFGSPAGLTVYEGRLLSERTRGALILADAGPGEIRSIRARPSGAGFDVDLEILLSCKKDRWFRPSDVAVAPDGSLFVADWYDPGVGGHARGDVTRGRVYRLAPPGAPYRLAHLDFDHRYGIAAALASPNPATRYRAYQAFTTGSVPKLDSVLPSYFYGRDPITRARALWLMDPGSPRGSKAIEEAMNDPRPEFRILAIRILAEQSPDALKKAEKLVTDPHAAVRRELLLALADAEGDWADRWRVDLALAWDGEDRFYREAVGISARGREGWIFERLLKRTGGYWDRRLAGLVLELHPPRALELLSSVASDPRYDPGRQIEALNAMAEINAKEAAEALVRRLGPRTPEPVQIAILQILARDYGPPLREWIEPETIEPFMRAALGNPAIARPAIDFISRSGMTGFVSDLMDLAKDNARLLEQRNRAARTASDLISRLCVEGQIRWLPDLKHFLHDPDEEVSNAALRAIGSIKNDEAAHLTRRVLTEPEHPRSLQTRLVNHFASTRSGSLMLLQLVESGDLVPELRSKVARATGSSRWEDVAMISEQLLPRAETADGATVPPVEELISDEMQSDPERGKTVFFAEDGPQCFRCHRIGAEGKPVGPDLTAIGAKLGREALIESILDPSAAIGHEYQVWILNTRSAGYLTGFIRGETDEAIELIDSAGERTEIPTSDIIERRASSTSLMPSGLSGSMTVQGLVDLAGYLATLK